MSQFPISRLPGASPLPSQESALSLPMMGMDQRTTVPVNTFEQLADALNGVGRTVASAINLDTEVKMSEARRIITERREKDETDLRRRREKSASVRLRMAEINLMTAGDPLAEERHLLELYEAEKGDPDIAADILNSAARSREAGLALTAARQEEQAKAAAALSDARRDQVLSLWAGQISTGLSSPEGLIEWNNKFDSVEDAASATALAWTKQARDQGLFQSQEEEIRFTTAAYDRASQTLRPLGEYQVRNRQDDYSARLKQDINALARNVNPESLTGSYEAFRESYRKMGVPDAVAVQQAGAETLRSVVAYQGGSNPVERHQDQIKMLRQIQGVTDPTAFSQAVDAVGKNLAESLSKALSTNYDALYSTQSQAAAFQSLKIPVDPDAAFAHWVNTVDPNAIDKMTKAVVGDGTDEFTQQAAVSIQADLRERYARGVKRLAEAVPQGNEAIAELSKVADGIPGADVNKAYEATATNAMFNGVLPDTEANRQSVVAELRAFAGHGKIPDKLVDHMTTSLKGQNPVAQSLALDAMATMTSAESNNLMGEMMKKDTSVATAALVTRILSTSGRTTDANRTFRDMLAHTERLGEILNNPITYKTTAVGDEALRSAFTVPEQGISATLVSPFYTATDPGFGEQDFIESGTAAMLRGITAFIAADPTLAQSYPDQESRAALAYEMLPAFGVKMAKEGNRIFAVKDPFNQVPDRAFDRTRINSIGREWVNANASQIIERLEQTRENEIRQRIRTTGRSPEDVENDVGRPWLDGDRLNQDWVNSLEFYPTYDQGQLLLPPDNPNHGVSFRMAYEGTIIDTSDTTSEYSWATIRDFNQKYQNWKSPTEQTFDYIKYRTKELFADIGRSFPAAPGVNVGTPTIQPN